MMVLLPIASAQGPPVPMPIAVKVLANFPGGVTVLVTNVNSDDTKQATTSEDGEVIFDWSDLPYTKGNVFTVEVNGQKQSATFVGTPLELFTFDLKSCNWVNCPACETCTCPVCPTQTPCPTETCPSQTPCPTQTCPSQTPCPAPTECTVLECPVCDTTVASIIAIIAGLLLGAGSGVGIQMYRNNKGGVTVKHKHLGIRGYHDINTIHNNPLYRHAKGELVPILPIK